MQRQSQGTGEKWKDEDGLAGCIKFARSGENKLRNLPAFGEAI
jgi:hypothetical protein